MKKYLMLMLLGWTVAILSVNDNAIVPDASYVIVGGTCDSVFREYLNNVPSGKATFYTFDGNSLKTVDYKGWSFEELLCQLDDLAPKPQPVRYEIKYWPAIKIGYKGTKGVPGYFILFYDKNDNMIKEYRYDNKTRKIILKMTSLNHGIKVEFPTDDVKKLTDFPLDLQKLHSNQGL